MGKKKMVMRRLAALLAASMVLTSSAFTSLAAGKTEADKVVGVSYTVKAEKTTLEVGDTTEVSVVGFATSSNADGGIGTASNANAKVENITWSSSDETILVVDGEGITATVTAKAEGTAEVIASLGKNISASCKIVVENISVDVKAPEIDEEDLKDFTERQIAEIKDEVEAQTTEIEAAVVEVSKQALPTSYNNPELAAIAEELGQPVELRLKGVKVELKAVVTKDPVTGEPVVSVQIDKFRVEISLVTLSGKEIEPKDGGRKISVPVKLPKEGILPEWKYATILHFIGGNENDRETLYSGIDDKADGRYVTIKTEKFSPFEMTFQENDPNKSSNNGGYGGGSGGGGSRSSSASGSWQRNETGWWFQYTNGGYAANKWESINGKWYYFNESGYAVTGWQLINGQWYFLDTANCDMHTGWHLDSVDGKWYYLSASGAMATGWVEVNGKSYYLSPAAAEPTYSYDTASGAWVYTKAGARPFGSMYVSETTPDGYQVDANGAWIQ